MASNPNDIAGVYARIADVMKCAADFGCLVQHRPEGRKDPAVGRKNAGMQVEHPLFGDCNHASLEDRAIPDRHDQVRCKGLDEFQACSAVRIRK